MASVAQSNEEIMNTPPKGVSRTFGFFILAFVTIGVAAIMWAMGHYHQPSVTTTPMHSASSGSAGWWNRYKATPVPTPMAYPKLAAAPYHIPMSPPMALPQPPAQAYQAPKAAPSPNEDAMRRHREYLAALSSSIVPKSDNGQVLETTPHAGANTPANSSITPIAVNAQPAPPYTVGAWSWIYAVLITGVDSDHPGDVLAQVSQDVKDTVTQTETLIPMGSKLHGTQGGRDQVRQNDTSLIVRWDDIELPNGGHIAIGDMPGTDPQGYPGFEDLVDNHYSRTWTPALLISAITAGTMLANTPTYGSSSGYNGASEAMGAGASRLGSFGQENLMNQLINNKPTIQIRPGYQFRVLCTKDMVFAGPYQAQLSQR
jgi:type IV secretory pathway VirB10-like protein